MTDASLLEVRDLSVRFHGEDGPVTAVADVSFDVKRGETLALVGESGSGKSVSSLAIMRLLDAESRVQVGGSIKLHRADGQTIDLLQLSEQGMQAVRGSEIAMIFQEPMTSLNPVHTVGAQIAEGMVHHLGLSRRAALGRTVELLDLVGIPEPRRRVESYPHHLSGGMRQRAMIAMALSCDPSLLIADEPTTALDVTIQAQILDLLQRLQKQTGMSIIFITHNLGVVAEVADRVAVIYAGRLVEEADVVPLFEHPLMPYTAGLLDSLPRLDLRRFQSAALRAIPGNVPDPSAMPSGCAFQPRCVHAQPGRCDQAIPPFEPATAGHKVRCVRWRDIAEAAA